MSRIDESTKYNLVWITFTTWLLQRKRKGCAACSPPEVLSVSYNGQRSSWAFVKQRLLESDWFRNYVSGSQTKCLLLYIFKYLCEFGQSCRICEKDFPRFLLYISPLLHSTQAKATLSNTIPLLAPEEEQVKQWHAQYTTDQQHTPYCTTSYWQLIAFFIYLFTHSFICHFSFPFSLSPSTFQNIIQGANGVKLYF